MHQNSSSQLQRVLVVDDELTLLTAIAEVLKGAGFDVLMASNGREAAAVAADYPIDLLITDLAMPEEDGIELIRRLKKQSPQVKIIAMSGTFGSDLLNVSKHLGADETLPKPMTATKLLGCIRRLDVGTSS